MPRQWLLRIFPQTVAAQIRAIPVVHKVGVSKDMLNRGVKVQFVIAHIQGIPGHSLQQGRQVVRWKGGQASAVHKVAVHDKEQV